MSPIGSPEVDPVDETTDPTEPRSRDSSVRRRGRRVVARHVERSREDETTDRAGTAAWESPGSGSPASAPQGDPTAIGRYRVIRRLGQGGFGRVYLARDDELDRPVAVKVPNPERVAGPEDVAAYLAEARTLAKLDHPHIVPVYDVGRTDDGLCYVVSKYVEGSDLAERMRQGRLTFRESAELVATVAEALHHAHTRGLVHRDVKPANILLDASGQAVRRRLRAGAEGRGLRQGGPPRRDARLHEPRAGAGGGAPGRRAVRRVQPRRRLLRAAHRPQAVPGRDADGGHGRDRPGRGAAAPAGRRHDPPRAGTGLPEDARQAGVGAVQHGPRPRRRPAALPPVRRLRRRPGVHPRPSAPAPGSTLEATPTPPRRRPDSYSRPAVKIVPKGLRSFDKNDADFFLELLPGPRDRDGLPDSLRFWKTRIETTDPDTAFKVGLIYGPSGCGKSSLVKAGLLPRLEKHVLSVYIEATPDETEARLLKALRRACPDLAPGLGLIETLAALRRGRGLRSGQKVLLVLDQFEQWLFARRNEIDTELVAALRQCDGERVQAVVMVRDDFWMAASPVHEGPGDPTPRRRELRRRRPLRPAARPQGPRGVRPGLRRLARAHAATCPPSRTPSSTRPSPGSPRTAR